MSGEVLSQEEVEHLLSAMDGAGPQAPRPGGPHGRAREKVSPYDFKRPERVGKEQAGATEATQNETTPASQLGVVRSLPEPGQARCRCERRR